MVKTKGLFPFCTAPSPSKPSCALLQIRVPYDIFLFSGSRCFKQRISCLSRCRSSLMFRPQNVTRVCERFRASLWHLFHIMDCSGRARCLYCFHFVHNHTFALFTEFEDFKCFCPHHVKLVGNKWKLKSSPIEAYNIVCAIMRLAASFACNH